jgi:predicted nucleic acid-binding protein
MSASTSADYGTKGSTVFDSDVLIWALRGNEAAAIAIAGAASRDISVISCMELALGAASKADLRKIQSFVEDLGFRTLPLSESIGHRAAIYVEEYGLAVAMSPADALIAATCVENRLPLCTGNVRHYRAIRELDLLPFKP